MALYGDMIIYEKNEKFIKPKKYNPDELYNTFIEFLELCKQIQDVPTFPGFMVYANLSYRCYYNYVHNEEYFHVIDKINFHLEHITVNAKLRHFTDVSKKMILQKYHNFTDRTDSKQTVQGSNIDVSTIISKLNPEQLELINNTDSISEIQKILESL